ncbi:MAG: hypothetical protein ABW217_06230 [Polyangiaceae bacterium]
MSDAVQPASVTVLPVAGDGPFPNNSRLPVLVYRAAFALPSSINAAAELIEKRFAANGWSGGWRNGVYDFHHFHANSHEVLGCYAGSVLVQLGGPSGPEVEIRRRDVLVLPAGVAHRRLRASADYRIVGAYPGGQSYDMHRGDPGELASVARQIAAVAVPASDPVHGKSGPLFAHWAA